MNFDSRIVIDTSTLVSAVLKPTSIPAQTLAAAMGLFEVIVSIETLDELKSVLQRAYLDRYRPIEQREQFFADYAAMALEVSVPEAVVACRDPKDDKFLSLAIAGGAHLILSSDQDLLTLEQYRGIPIITPRAFVDLSA
jgi:putative PIN family toxin of toxin-antitoxin system